MNFELCIFLKEFYFNFDELVSRKVSEFSHFCYEISKCLLQIFSVPDVWNRSSVRENFLFKERNLCSSAFITFKKTLPFKRTSSHTFWLKSKAIFKNIQLKLQKDSTRSNSCFALDRKADIKLYFEDLLPLSSRKDVRMKIRDTREVKFKATYQRKGKSIENEIFNAS